MSVLLLGGLLFSMAAAADLPDQSTDVAAQVTERDKVIEAVEQKYADVTTIKAAFVQTTHSEIFGDEAQVGNLTIKRPSKMRWDFTEAGKQFITNGETMWVYTQPDNQVIRFDDVSGQADTAQALLQSLDKLDELFLVDLLPSEADQKAFDLRPKEPGQFKKIQLVFDGELVLQQVSITDAYDSVTDIAFTAVELGPEVDDSIFSFTVPEGVEVITAGAF